MTAEKIDNSMHLDNDDSENLLWRIDVFAKDDDYHWLEENKQLEWSYVERPPYPHRSSSWS